MTPERLIEIKYLLSTGDKASPGKLACELGREVDRRGELMEQAYLEGFSDSKRQTYGGHYRIPSYENSSEGWAASDARKALDGKHPKKGGAG